jgi:AhpD family alkylhydroperoxidase
MAPALSDRVLGSVTEKPSRYQEDYTMNTTVTTSWRQRMDNAATLVPEAIKAILAVSKAAKNDTVPETTVELVHLRASQINGCSVCVDMHSRALKKAGEGDERIFAVSAWRDSPYFDDAERAVLALTESVTRLADRTDPVPDEIWDEAARYYDDKALASLLLEIGLINLWNRLNVPTRQLAGQVW